jgi:HAD superfamily hydrolase (TIGR01509 family)
MIKVILFDLDGVLIEAKEIHFKSLNLALSEIDEKYVISLDEHLSKYDGLKTVEKLNLLSKLKGLPDETHQYVWQKKQEHTIELLNSIEEDGRLIQLFKSLKEEGYTLGCCSNSIDQSVRHMLTKLGLINLVDFYYSNESILNSKPSADIYWHAMAKHSFNPEETLIVEDSPNGLKAAYRSGANVLRVKNSSELTYENIKNKIAQCPIDFKYVWEDNKLNVLIPMAGAGSRFEKAGYKLPKPLIDVKGKPMISKVVENLNFKANYIFLVQQAHLDKYNLEVLLRLIVPDCKIVVVDGLTEGAACTTLLAKEYINNDNPLIIANSDQWVEWDNCQFMYKMNEGDVDGGIVTFKATDSKWSFAKIDDNGYVTEVAEKNPISDLATVGIYYYKQGKSYVQAAEQMIEKNIRVNNEFYVCPVFNEMILNGLKIKTYNASEMWGLGTPEDLNFYLNNK